MKALVPDLALVPRLFTNSFFVMPMPESSIWIVEVVLSGMILMKKFGWASIFSRICHGLVADLVGGIG